jgi:hypothetical protein
VGYAAACAVTNKGTPIYLADKRLYVGDRKLDFEVLGCVTLGADQKRVAFAAKIGQEVWIKVVDVP